VRAVSTVKNAPTLLAERSRHIKVAHGIPVPPPPAEDFRKPDGPCRFVRPAIVQQITDEHPLGHCEVFRPEAGSARAMLSGTPFTIQYDAFVFACDPCTCSSYACALLAADKGDVKVCTTSCYTAINGVGWRNWGLSKLSVMLSTYRPAKSLRERCLNLIL
jgi:hypothetical protein